VAVFSLARLYSTTGAEEDGEKLVERRAVTEALHELGHVFDLSHCLRCDCVMWFSNTLAETDFKGTRFCPKNLQELRAAMRRRAPVEVFVGQALPVFCWILRGPRSRG